MLTLFSALAVKKALETLVPGFTAETGIPVETVYDPTTVLMKRIEAGAKPDVVIAVTETLAALGRPTIPIARTGVGVAVAPDVSIPDTSTVPALREALTSARSVAYSRTGASGIYFASLIEHLGIADEVNARATVVEKGFTALAVLDGRADLAIQQMSELKFVPEARVVGPLPEEVQHYSDFSVALGTGAAPDAVLLRDFLCGQSAKEAYARAGLTPAEGDV
ncbi:molybdate ABC transporter substrate-binding protein [Kibdelosporangium phytohabitans]|uniref:Molybdenum ABC transporter substrate-binding protein n=1 Tax=Kibdelosporangium phytohabitans TaxID=860235 RepID=A0A0N9I977_9PSEU|nr:substrate-binding domain-containing protein [Kibdelosporangium phytohabitans]ALG12514.1 molybdenum ABC transporter substrate-binding protein [Kibdelosporangium phytohabitans]MBE1464117.1 molybdate transport system substrate-binding protein [Kibdelosporangium phytohabitans]